MVAEFVRRRLSSGCLVLASLCGVVGTLDGCAAHRSSRGPVRAAEIGEVQVVACAECERAFGIDGHELWLQRPGQAPCRLERMERERSASDERSRGETEWIWRTRLADTEDFVVHEFRRCLAEMRGGADSEGLSSRLVLCQRFVVIGLRAEWSVVVRVSLVRTDGSSVDLRVHGAPVAQGGGLSEIEIPLARDEATRLEYR